MARAQGARAQMKLAYETVYGAAPNTGFRLMPFARTTLGSEQPLLTSELLGYAHFRYVPKAAWRWPSFSPAEIARRGTGSIKINTKAMDKLQALRDRLGKPLIVRSASRSPRHTCHKPLPA